MGIYSHLTIRKTLLVLVIALLLGGCWPWGRNSSSFPADSIWQFEIKYELMRLRGMSSPGGCRGTPVTCDCDGVTSICTYVCVGQQAYGEPIYWEHSQVFGGEFKVGPELGRGSGYHQLTPLDIWASMKEILPFSEYSKTCITPYGERGDTHGRHGVYEVFNAADVLEWWGQGYIEDGEVNIYIDAPSDHWKVWEYTYWRSYNTIPGLVSGIGSWSGSDIYYLVELDDQWGVSPLKNGQSIEEYGPLYTTDNGGFSYIAEHSTTTVTLQCIENCRNFDCSEPCYDGKECTDDTCLPGQGCTFEHLEGSCSDNECFEEGVCQGGECIQTVEVNCEDNNPCTIDDCHPLYGCIYSADNKILRNINPQDCWQTICWNGAETFVPDPNENPVQGPNDDCFVEICIAGYGEISIPTDSETPPQNAPGDCLREMCTTAGTVESIPIGSEPGCSCTFNWQCEDGNPCTRETCDQASNTCVNHSPDDNLIPPEIPANCKDEVCQGGQVVLLPDDTDMPVDVDPYDCQQQYCSEDGQILTAPDPDEYIGCAEQR